MVLKFLLWVNSRHYMFEYLYLLKQIRFGQILETTSFKKTNLLIVVSKHIGQFQLSDTQHS